MNYDFFILNPAFPPMTRLFFFIMYATYETEQKAMCFTFDDVSQVLGIDKDTLKSSLSQMLRDDLVWYVELTLSDGSKKNGYRPNPQCVVAELRELVSEEELLAQEALSALEEGLVDMEEN